MNLSASFARMKLAPLMLVLVSMAVAGGVYLQALNYPFISDDKIYILDGAKLARLHLAELWRLFTGPYNDFSEFLPLRDLSYWIDMSLFGPNPSAFRAHNILLYLLCLPLAYATTLGFWRYFRPNDAASAPWAAAAVTALFALHPTLVESVVWISGRKYVLPNLFSMLALWLAMSARREHGLSAPYAAAAMIAFVAVMLSKASYVAVAPVIAMLWLLFWLDIPAPGRHRSQLLWPLAILLLAGFMIRIFIDSSIGREPAYFGVEAVIRVLAVLGWLARLAVSPESRSFFYPVFEDPYLPIMATLGMAVLAASAIGAAMMLRRRSLEGFAFAAFLLFCLPYVQLIPYAAPSLVSDRYLALAVWPGILLVVALSWRLNPLPRTVLLLAIALAWGLQTAERTRDWRNGEAFLDSMLRAYPGHYMPAFQKIFRDLSEGLYRDAIETANNVTSPELKKAMTGMIKAGHAVSVNVVSSENPMAHLNNFGLILSQPPIQSKWNSPMLYVWQYCRSIHASQWDYLARQFPDDALVRYNAGLWLLNDQLSKDAASYLNDQKSRYAITHLRAATESPRLPESVRGAAFYNFGLALLSNGQIAKAEAPLRAALEQQPPDSRAYCLLSKMYKQTQRFEEAERAEANCNRTR